MDGFLLQLFIFLAAAGVAVPLAKKMGLGSVLGYLVAGVAIGPFGLALVSNVESIMHFTEFGVVMMLFLVGLELRPSLLWKMRMPILGVGGTQVIVSSLFICLIATYFLPWQQALAVGLTLSLSSTAIVLQTLKERGQMDTSAGRSIFSVLLFQDLAVIPMLAGIPLLATLTISGDQHASAALFDINALPGYQQALITVAAIGLVLVVGKYASGPMFRSIAAAKVREVFVASALGLVIGTSVLMLLVGLSPALGAFLAGVMLSDSEFRHQLESDIDPIKGLLLGIFFISSGALLNFALIGEMFSVIVGIALGLMLLKWLILVVIGRVFKIHRADRPLFAVSLAQGGEFAFVLFQMARSNGVLPVEVIEPILSAVAISMFLTPIVFVLYDKWETSRPGEQIEHAPDVIEKKGHRVILAGFGRSGTDVGRFLQSAGITPVILDHDAHNVKILRKFGFEVFFGDATRLDLLESAGAHDAELLIVTTGDPESSLHLIEIAHKHFPHLKIVASAQNRKTMYEMMDLGVTNVFRETFGGALEVGKAALKELGMEPYRAHRLSLIFQKKDREIAFEMYKLRGEEHTYISSFHEHHANLEKIMELDIADDRGEIDNAWTSKSPEA